MNMEKTTNLPLEQHNIAFLRSNQSHNFCELFFNVTIKNENLFIHQDITAVCKVTDNLYSLLENVQKKIFSTISSQKALEHPKEKNSSDECLPKEIAEEIPVHFKRKSKLVNCRISLVEFLNQNHVNTKLLVLGQKYKVLVNAPYVRAMQLPAIIHAQFTIQPNKFVMSNTDKGLSEFEWYRSKDKIKWEKVCSNFSYVVNDDDVDHYLKIICTPKNETGVGLPAESISENTVTVLQTIPKCPFEERHQYTNQNITARVDFRVVSYNTLAEKYSETNKNFPYCSPESLSIDYRKQLLLKELFGYNADIICLQEVDNKIFSTYFKPEFQKKEFGTIYNRKGNKIPEGLACFYNKNKFRLLRPAQQIVFSEDIKTKEPFQKLWNSIKSNKFLCDEFLRQSTSLQIIVLQHKATKKALIVGNTHLYYHPEATHIRLLQSYMATIFLETVKRRLEKEKENVSVIFCGDFNTSPCSTAYSFLSTGLVSAENEDYLKVAEKRNLIIKHNFQFRSAYGTPKYTNYTEDFKGCLDYIFVENNKLKINEVVPLPTSEKLAEYVGLPNDVYPSDHLALIVTLGFK